jgi:crotonobetaine/carnitine-CoA ligase
VLDEDGGPVADGEVGELCVRPRRPEGVMSGYFDMPAETLHAFRGLWYHTGDAVRRDEDGFFHLVGRLKDFIRHKGENISATEVEAVVNRHPGVADSAAVGEPDEWGEEEVVVYVEAADGSLELDALRRHCAEALPDFMVPARIAVVESLPRNALGRVEKFRLRQP